jgi:hypothetical protein
MRTRASLSTRLRISSAVLSVAMVSSVATSGWCQDGELWETRVFIADECPTAPSETVRLAPLLLAALNFVIPKVVDFGISYANASLQSKKEEEQKKNEERYADAVTTYDGFYLALEVPDGATKKPDVVLALENKCLVVLRGNFTSVKATPDFPDDCAQFKQEGLRVAKACKWLHERGIYPSSSPATRGIGIYLEAKFVFSPDRQNFRLEPHYLVYERPIRPSAPVPPQTEVPYDVTFTFTFEGAAAGQSATPFGMAVLPFQQITAGTVLQPGVLSQRTSGWTPTLPLPDQHQADLRRAQALYETVAKAPEQIVTTKRQIATAEAKVRALLEKLSAIEPLPAPALTADIFTDGRLRAEAILDGEKLDSRLIEAELNSNPETAPGSSTDPIERARKEAARLKRIRAVEALRALVLDLKEASARGLALQSAAEVAQAELDSKKNEVALWAKKTYPLGPINVKVSLKEKSYAASNLLLLTAADAFAASKQDLSGFITQTLTQSLGLQPRDEKVSKLAEQAQLQIAAKVAYNAVQNAQAELTTLGSDAPDLVRRQKAFAVELAKISANLAFVKAGLTPPFPEAFGGDFR